MRGSARDVSTCGAVDDNRARRRYAWATGRFHPFEFAIRESLLFPTAGLETRHPRPLIDELADDLATRLRVGKLLVVPAGEMLGRVIGHVGERAAGAGSGMLTCEGLVEMAGTLDSPVDWGLRLAECDALLLGLEGRQESDATDGVPEIVVIPHEAGARQVFLDRLAPEVKALVYEGDPPVTRLPCFHRRDIAGLALFLEACWLERVPAMRGLVLAGGRSVRMGEDKADLRYGRGPQAAELVEMLSQFCAEVFVSRAPGQGLPRGIRREQVLEDRHLDLGPLGGILTAQDLDPAVAWLAVGCDLPFLDCDVLGRLAAARASMRNATCFLDAERGLPEPVCTIWEPKAHLRAVQLLALGRRCPRKILIESRIRALPAPEGRLFNANTPEERLEAERKLARDSSTEAPARGTDIFGSRGRSTRAPVEATRIEEETPLDG